MKYQKGSTYVMVTAVLVVIIGLLATVLVTTHNSYVALEEGIVAADRSRQTTLSNLSQKVKEVIGIRQLSVDDIKQTVTEQIKSRSGEGGYKAYVLMLKEHNVAPDPAMYQKIINIIDVGRSGFESAEKMLIDRKQIACVKKKQVPGKWLLGLMGTPTLNIGCGTEPDDYPVILSASAAETFRTGIDGGLY